jgi:GTPase
MNLPIVAIVGPPNAGKSTLLNKISGQHVAVTSEVAGTTRDRQYLDVAWNKQEFTLVDTAGLDFSAIDELDTQVNKQIDIALEQADMLVFVVDGKVPAATIPQATIRKFRTSKKPVALAINKIDSPQKLDAAIAEFKRLGIKNMFPISSVTGRGIGDLLDHIVSSLPKAKEQEPKTDNSIAVAIVGKPNVGKSSIFNSILGEERVVVSNVPGTTRTAIDSHVKRGNIDYTFIDTAGLKKKTHRQAKPDIFSGFQTYKSIRRSDVCFFVIDSVEEITKQDQAIAQEIFAQDKGCIILANKFDIYKGDEDKLRDYISHHFPFLWMCPMFFVSGKTGEGLTEALEAVQPIYERRHKEVSAEELNALLKKWMKKNPPKLLRDQKQPKVYGLTQLATNPPLFELLVNVPAAISMQFRKSIQNAIIKELDFWGTPVNLTLRKKS